MGRSKIKPLEQPDEYTCGPSAIKIALSILGKRSYSLKKLIKICRTTKQGTTTQKMIQALKYLNIPFIAIEKANLKHIQSGLKTTINRPRALIVSYLYSIEYNNPRDVEYEHWAAVASYQNHKSRIVLFDSYSAQKKSYQWQDFRKRWIGYEKNAG